MATKSKVMKTKTVKTRKATAQEAPSLLHSAPPTEKEIAELTIVDAPLFSVSGVQVQGTGNDFVITLTRPRPMRNKMGVFATVAFAEPVAIVTMSPQSAKDLVAVLANAVGRHEAEFGQINSPYLAKLQHDRAKGN